jgi:predicted phage terminase large subunit-like protein
MVLMHAMTDGRFVIENVTRGQWSALEREQRLRQLAEVDAKLCNNYCVGVEQEPGSGGKESAETTIRNLAGYSVYADKVTGSKEIRAEPFAAQVQAGNVWLVAGNWIEDFLDEAETWPASKYLDQIDACSGAFNRLALGSCYNLDAMQ